TGHHGEQAGYQLYLDLLGAQRILGVPGAEVGNRLVDLEDVLGAFGAELTERLNEAADAKTRHEIAQRLLAARVSEDHRTAPEVASAVARLKPTHGAARVESLAAEVGWSRRHLTARFHEAVGLPPKALARVIRVEHATRRMRAGDPLGDVAYAAGY